MSNDTTNDSIQVTRREVIKGAAALAASTALTASTAVAAARAIIPLAGSPDPTSPPVVIQTTGLIDPTLSTNPSGITD